jgi:hypothetical protein
MDQNLKVKLLARDLRNGNTRAVRAKRRRLRTGCACGGQMPRSARGMEGEYHSNCPLDQRWLKFAEIDYDDFRAPSPPVQLTMRLRHGLPSTLKSAARRDHCLNNKERDLHLIDLPMELQ